MNSETIEKVLKGAESVAHVTAQLGSELLSEAINFYIFLGILQVLKAACVFLLLYLANRMLSFLEDEYKVAKIIGRTVLSCAALAWFFSHSFEPVANVGKAIIAPRVFLLEKSKELLEGHGGGK
jgi:hypothetical protein